MILPHDTHFRGAIDGVLNSIAALTGEGVVYQDMTSAFACRNGNLCAFCAACLNHPQTESYCRHAIRSAAMASFASGEPHYYQCWAGLLFVTVAVAPRRECRGAMEIGGFFPVEEQAVFHDGLTHHLAALSAADRIRLLRVASALRPISAGALRGLGRLLMETTCSHGLNSSDFIQEQNRRYQQQREIAEAIQETRRATEGVAASPSPGTPADIYPLLTYLQQNDRDRARRFVSGYLARLLMASNWDLPRLKAHLRLLLAVLTSESMLQGESWTAATSRELQQMLRLERTDSTEAACALIADIVLERFAHTRPVTTDPPALSGRVLDWLRRHYGEKATLETAAKSVGAAPSSIVQHVRRDTRKSFHRHLTEIRVAEAKKLLACTQMDISRIADRCGFADQSHFTRTFKIHINLTPGEFRRMLRLPLTP